MATLRNILFVIILCLPAGARAQVSAEALPAGTVWYLHANLEQMRNSDSGRELYRWLDGEIFMEIHDEVGIDINRETDSVTAFSDRDNGTVILVEGRISKESRQKLLDIAERDATLDTLKHEGMTYYHVRDPVRHEHDEDDDEEAGEDNGSHHRHELLVDLDDSAWFSFALSRKLIITSSEQQMWAMLDNGGRVAGSSSHSGALFVLTADRTFVQAGLRTGELADDDDDWDSNILRNTEQAALLISDREDLIAVQAQLVSSDPKMTESIGGIVNGLIALQAFNSELDPDIRSLIQNTRIEVEGNVLSINTVIEPGLVVSVLSD